MQFLLRPLRLILVVMVIAGFLSTMCLLWLFIRNRWRLSYVANRVLTIGSRAALTALSIRVNVIGRENMHTKGGTLFVGNHLSYIDVLVIASQIPMSFVTSTDIRNSLGLGQICLLAGCLFVDRKNKRNLANEISEIQEGLQYGLKVAIFPEATSTNGEQILRFRKPLYLAATNSSSNVVPFVLNYRTVGRKPIDSRSRDSIFWYGDMDFVPHLWRLAGSGGVTVDLNILEPIHVSPATDAGALTEQTQRLVEKTFIPVK